MMRLVRTEYPVSFGGEMIQVAVNNPARKWISIRSSDTNAFYADVKPFAVDGLTPWYVNVVDRGMIFTCVLDGIIPTYPFFVRSAASSHFIVVELIDD